MFWSTLEAPSEIYIVFTRVRIFRRETFRRQKKILVSVRLSFF